MSIENYTELQSAITRWIARDDMASNIPDWIGAFEAVANRRLRTRQMEAFAALSGTGGQLTLPTDYLAWRELTILDGNVHPPLEYVTPQVARSLNPLGAQGEPQFFSIAGTSLAVFPYDDTRRIALFYFQKILPIQFFNTNWLLDEHPDVYLFGSLYHAYDFMLDLQNAAFRKAQRDEILDEIQTLSNKTRGVGGMRLIGVPTP